jgi:hypothetical protein
LELTRASLVALLASAGAACSSARASTPVERPALEVPPPPPRVIVANPGPDQPFLEPVEELPAVPNAAPTRPRPQREKPEAKQEPPKTEAAPPPPDPIPPVSQPAPAPQLKTAENAGGAAQLTAQIRDSLTRTRGILDKIDPNGLSEQRRKAHADAKLFAQQADEALKGNNLLFAKELAEKAERLAKELQGR